MHHKLQYQIKYQPKRIMLLSSSIEEIHTKTFSFSPSNSDIPEMELGHFSQPFGRSST